MAITKAQFEKASAIREYLVIEIEATLAGWGKEIPEEYRSEVAIAIANNLFNEGFIDLDAVEAEL